MDCGLILENQRGSFAKRPGVDRYEIVDLGLDLIWIVGSRSGGWYATRRCGRRHRAPAARLGGGGSLA